MSEVKIDKGIPIPSMQGSHYTPYPWAIMEVGDSFVHEGRSTAVYAAAKGWAVKLNRKFTARKLPTGGHRVWRVS